MPYRVVEYRHGRPGAWLFLAFAAAAAGGARGEVGDSPVQIFHLIDNSLWGEVDGSALQGSFLCGGDRTSSCELISTDARITGKSKAPDNLLGNIRGKFASRASPQALTVGLYNIHTWAPQSAWPHHPDACLLPTHLDMAESEESTIRFRKLFSASFSGFDGNSTTHPHSSVQRSYVSTGIFNASVFLPLKPLTSLIPGAAYVASTCHRGRALGKREEVVTRLQQVYRVDSLGKCHKTVVKPDTVTLRMGKSALETLRLKQEAISHYLFYLAFENSVEPGYVTEKVFDALIAGTVPVYLGPTDDCKKMLPDPKAAIFLDDFNDDVQKLGTYLTYLASNESAYEEHRAWRRHTKSSVPLPVMITQPWPCRICSWARKFFAAGGGKVSEEEPIKGRVAPKREKKQCKKN